MTALAKSAGEVVLSRGKYQGVRLSDIPTWYLRWAANNGYMLRTPEWKAVLDELRRRERSGRG